MSTIRLAVVTAKVNEKTKQKLNEMIGEGKVKYFEPFSFVEMQKLAASGMSREEIIAKTKEHKAAVASFVKENNPDVAILGHDIDASILAGNGMKWIHCTHAGVEKSATAEVFERGITVTSSAGRNAEALAEHALMFILALTYNINHIRDTQKAHKFGLGPAYKKHTALFGKTVGIIGCGHNGTELAKRLKACGVRVLGYDRNTRSDENFDSIVEAGEENLRKIAVESDFLVLTVSLNDSTFHMINEEILSIMKPSSYLINIARGGLVDERALEKALENHEIAGAGLDTFENEPLREDSPLWDMPEVICTPHTTPQIRDMEEKQWEFVFANIKAYQEDGQFVNALKSDDLYSKRKV
ncbi:MAG: hypothetical protein K5634_01770 [Sphaerochaetaceae bacterium]|nr:hypothetical protein [Sphaerochaetaceae bacterium]